MRTFVWVVVRNAAATSRIDDKVTSIANRIEPPASSLLACILPTHSQRDTTARTSAPFLDTVTMRLTRAAQRAQQDVEEPIEASEDNERVLKDVEPNSSPAAHTEEPLPAKTPAKTPSKKGRGKGAKKGAKGKKAKTEEEELAQVVEEAERQAAASSENEEVDQDLPQEHEHGE